MEGRDYNEEAAKNVSEELLYNTMMRALNDYFKGTGDNSTYFQPHCGSVERGGAPTKKVAKKEPTKKKTNPYIVFSVKRRKELAIENPGASFVELTKLVSAEWRGLSAEQKARFG